MMSMSAAMGWRFLEFIAYLVESREEPYLAETRRWKRFWEYFMNTNRMVSYFYMAQYLIITEMR